MRRRGAVLGLWEEATLYCEKCKVREGKRKTERGEDRGSCRRHTISQHCERDRGGEVALQLPNIVRVCVCIPGCVFLAVLISVGVIDRVVESAEQSD